MQRTETLYLSLSTHQSSDGFHAEIEVAKTYCKQPQEHQIIKISAIGALHSEFNLRGEKFEPNEIRIKSHLLIKKSGIKLQHIASDLVCK